MFGWLQRDPLGLAAGANLYLYSAGAPLSELDPSGLLTVLEWLIIVAIILALIGLLYVLLRNTNTLDKHCKCPCPELCAFRDGLDAPINELTSVSQKCQTDPPFENLGGLFGHLIQNDIAEVGQHLVGAMPAAQARPQCIRDLINYIETEDFCHHYPQACGRGGGAPGFPSSTQVTTPQGVCLWVNAELFRLKEIRNLLSQEATANGCNC